MKSIQLTADARIQLGANAVSADLPGQITSARNPKFSAGTQKCLRKNPNWQASVNINRQTDKHASDWQTIGKLELSDATNPNAFIHGWLSEILQDLNLSSEFFERFLKAIQTSAARARETNSLILPMRIHIPILASHMHSSSGKSWGFFQIEKIEVQAGSAASPELAIDFYLYVEGN